MMFIQRALKLNGSRKTNASQRIHPSYRSGEGSQEIGFPKPGKINILRKNDILLFTSADRYPGFAPVYFGKSVFRSQGRPQVILPVLWVKEYLKEKDSVRAFYTKHGLFVRPLGNDKEFKDYELTTI